MIQPYDYAAMLAKLNDLSNLPHKVTKIISETYFAECAAMIQHLLCRPTIAELSVRDGRIAELEKEVEKYKSQQRYHEQGDDLAGRAQP